MTEVFEDRVISGTSAIPPANQAPYAAVAEGGADIVHAAGVRFVTVGEGEIGDLHIGPTCRQRDIDRYRRIVGQCFLPDGRDITAAMIASGTAKEFCRFSRNHYRTC